ncbi:MAG: anti-sigma factor family protein [bacterium]
MMKCIEVDDLLEAHIDGDLAAGLSRRVGEHVATCADCRKKLELALSIAEELRSLPVQECPERVFRSVLKQIQPESRRRFRRLMPDLSQLRPRLVWGLTCSLAAAVLILITFSLYPPSQWFKGGQPHYTPQEIAQAKKEALLAFGYVNYATSRTQSILEEQIIPAAVLRPLKIGIEAVTESIKKGENS